MSSKQKSSEDMKVVLKHEGLVLLVVIVMILAAHWIFFE